MDGELSQLETHFLDSHLRRCNQCAEFAQGVQRLTQVLREAPFVLLDRPIELPLRRRVTLGARRAVSWIAAASAAAAALLAVMVLPAQRVHTTGTPTPSAVTTNNEDLRDLRILRRAQMMPTALILARTSPRGPEL